MIIKILFLTLRSVYYLLSPFMNLHLALYLLSLPVNINYHASGRKTSLNLAGISDQWGNVVTGRELTRRKAGREAFSFTCPLIT